MQTVADSALVFCALVCTASLAAAQTPVGALAIDERQGDQYGWAVDYEMAGAAQARGLSECGGGCRVVLTFNRCAAYAVDQDAGGTAVGWAESFASVAAVRPAVLSERSSRGGSGCIVPVWGCNGPVVEEELGLDRAARQRIQRGLQAAGFDPGGADDCSARARERRYGAGRRHGALVRRAIWTARRWRRYGRLRWASRRCVSVSRPPPTRLRRLAAPDPRPWVRGLGFGVAAAEARPQTSARRSLVTVRWTRQCPPDATRWRRGPLSRPGGEGRPGGSRHGWPRRFPPRACQCERW